MKRFVVHYLSTYRGLQKKALENAGSQKVIINKRPYDVDGEAGRFNFQTYSVVNGDCVFFDTCKDVFPALRGKEFYRTVGFKELAYLYGDTDESYRKTKAG